MGVLYAAHLGKVPRFRAMLGLEVFLEHPLLLEEAIAVRNGMSKVNASMKGCSTWFC
jgi:hypothetical protein